MGYLVPSDRGARRFQLIGRSIAPRRKHGKMFEHLKDLGSSIVVTGSGRAGTRITTAMIAHDLGWKYLDENNIRQNNWDLLLEHCAEEHCVVQAPDLWKRIHLLPAYVGIVVVRRPIGEILTSWDRHSTPPKDDPREVYEGLERTVKDRATWIDYADLEGHPLWVEEDTRRKIGKAWTWTRIAV